MPDIEDLTAALQIDQFSVIGISGGTPYALACLHRLGPRIRTATVISGMGPLRLSDALQGMDRTRRLAMEIGSRYPNLAKRESRRWGERFRAHPTDFLSRLVSTWPAADQELFARKEIFDLFLPRPPAGLHRRQRPRDICPGAEALPQLRLLTRRLAPGKLCDPVAGARRRHRPTRHDLEDGTDPPPLRGPTLCRGDILSRSPSRTRSSPA